MKRRQLWLLLAPLLLLPVLWKLGGDYAARVKIEQRRRNAKPLVYELQGELRSSVLPVHPPNLDWYLWDELAYLVENRPSVTRFHVGLAMSRAATFRWGQDHSEWAYDRRKAELFTLHNYEADITCTDVSAEDIARGWDYIQQSRECK